MKKNTATKKFSDTYTTPYNLRSNAFATTVKQKNTVAPTNLKNHTQTINKSRNTSKIIKNTIESNIAQPTTTSFNVKISTKSIPLKAVEQRLRSETVKSSTLMQSSQSPNDNQITVSSSIDNDSTFTNDTTVIEKKVREIKKKRADEAISSVPISLSKNRFLTRSIPAKSLTFDQDGNDSDDEEENIAKNKKELTVADRSTRMTESKNAQKAPPNKKFRKLRLCDTPYTPKTLMKKSSLLEASPPTILVNEHMPPVLLTSSTNDMICSNAMLFPNQTTVQNSTLHEHKQLIHTDVKRTNTHQQFRRNLEQFLKPPVPSSFDLRSNLNMHESKNQNLISKLTPSSYRSQSISLKVKSTNKALSFDDSDSDDADIKLVKKMSPSPISWSSFSTCKRLTASTNGVNEPVNDIFNLRLKENDRQTSLHMICSPDPQFLQQQLHASINPFTPPSNSSIQNRQVSRDVSLVKLAAANYSAIKQKASSMTILSTENQKKVRPSVENSRLPIRKCLVSRYHQEFHEVCKLGSGEFGDVFKCINRLDGCTYAIKRSKQAIAGSAMEISAWKEVCAHAVLVKHNHIVQYYSAWAEQDRMLIQNEYCNGGSLAEFLDSLKLSNMQMSAPTSSASTSSSSLCIQTTMMNESDLKTLLLHVAKGLSYMHSLHLAHLDIKPGNIFICRVPRRHTQLIGLEREATTAAKGTSSSDGSSVVLNEESGIESDDLDESDHESMTSSVAPTSVFSELVTYKIGDLGHVTSTLHENPHVEEGDCRYLPNEILQENYSWLVKADIFALALTVYVAGLLEDLPKNGDEWHWIRQGNLKDLPQCSENFKKLLNIMVHQDPAQRPSASTLVHHPFICPDSKKTKSQLRKELNHEKFKNEILQRKVKKYEEQINKLDSPFSSVFLQKFSNGRHDSDLWSNSEASSKNLTISKLTRSYSFTLV